MALSASIFSPSPLPPLRVKLFKHGTCQLNGSFRLHPFHLRSPKNFMKVTMAQSGEPNNVEFQSIVKEKLAKAFTDSVKNFPWKEAESVLLNRVMLLGQKALKWSLISLFIYSSFSDFILAVSKNKELMVPLGLLIGCSTTSLLREILQEFFGESQFDMRQLTVISFFFLFVKFASMQFALQARIFLLHVGNGGLMQALWLYRNSPREETSNEEQQYSTGEEVKGSSLVTDAED